MCGGVAGGFVGVSAMEADEGGVLAVAEGRDEAEGGVVAEAEDGEADGLHESPVMRRRYDRAACDHVKAKRLRSYGTEARSEEEDGQEASAGQHKAAEREGSADGCADGECGSEEAQGAEFEEGCGSKGGENAEEKSGARAVGQAGRGADGA